MALSGYVNWEVRPATGSDTACSGGFDPSQTAGMLTDGAATSATGSAPVFTSASYSFVSGDVGAKVYIASGSNWVPGWYAISSVAGGAATLNATASQSTLANGQLNTVAGCATTASPTGATWAIDYSQQASAQFTYTDLVIGSTTTHLTSAGNPFGAQQVGNLVQITSGTNFTTGWYCIQSMSGSAAVMDRSVGTAAASSGHGNLGGAFATLSTNLVKSSPLLDQGQLIWMTGTLTITSSVDFPATTNDYSRVGLHGYGTYRGDGTHAEIACSTNSVHMIEITTYQGLSIRWIDLTNTAGSPGDGIRALSAQSQQVTLQNMVISGCATGVNVNNGSSIWFIYPIVLVEVEIKSCTSHGLDNAGVAICHGCYFHGNGGSGVHMTTGNTGNTTVCIDCVSAGNTLSGYEDASSGASSRHISLTGCVAYNNTEDGLRLGQGSNVQGYTAINCIFYDNGGYGINWQTSVAAAFRPGSIQVERNCAFGANTSGARTSGAPGGYNDVTLTGNPFNNAGSGDFSLNATAGAGAACTGAGWQSAII
jgi:hypothetical protein